jgi:NADH dehydrogenase
MTLLVTGATGDLGIRLLHDLAARGEVVRASTRQPLSAMRIPAETETDSTIEWVQADLLDPPSLRRACQGVRALVHMAALTHAPRAAAYHEVNVRGTEQLLTAAAEAGVELLLYVSTRAVGESGGAYSHSKALAEECVRAGGLPWIIIRPAEVYGTGGRDPVLSLATSLRDRSFVPVLGDGSYALSPVHVQDTLAAIVRAVDLAEARGRTYVLAGPEELTYLELIERVERMLDLPRRRRIHVPLCAARILFGTLGRMGIGPYVPDQIPRLLLAKSADITAARRDLDFQPRDLESGLRPLLRSAS